MKVGNAGIARATLMVAPMTNIGVLFHFIPLARIAKTVVVIFAPAIADEIAKIMMVTMNAFIPAPAWTLNGA